MLRISPTGHRSTNSRGYAPRRTGSASGRPRLCGRCLPARRPTPACPAAPRGA
jgi:hypothetical protein